MDRELIPKIQVDLKRKMVLVSGPRQAGKTTLARMLASNVEYFNYDNPDDHLLLKEKSWKRKTDLLILDELHKMKNWKSWLKGVYDTEGIHPPIIVTGSAKMNISRKMGDSMAGRYFHYTLHPFTLKELKGKLDAGKAFRLLLSVGGFPEPFLTEDLTFYKRWKRTHLDIILRQDLLDFDTVRNIKSIEILVSLLKKRVGSQISYNSLARDLDCDPKTVKRWLEILENLYVVFKVSPYHRNVARSLLKEPKYYFFDTGQVEGDNGVKMENVIAASLLRECHFLRDTKGIAAELYYLRTKDGREVDFLIVLDGQPTQMIESKWKSNNVSPGLNHFKKYFPEVKRIQLVHNLAREKQYPDGLFVLDAIPWLTDMPICE
ncbi:MAG: ATP-binding protein [Acidobacteria bacterium]|nr:MAG: ATP-binding protein [Acidobacteriota bacterium]